MATPRRRTVNLNDLAAEAEASEEDDRAKLADQLTGRIVARVKRWNVDLDLDKLRFVENATREAERGVRVREPREEPQQRAQQAADQAQQAAGEARRAADQADQAADQATQPTPPAPRKRGGLKKFLGIQEEGD